jgi:hypothetical protein
MIRIAEPQDLEDCQNLIKQIGNSEKVSQNYLYLNDRTHGFTVIVENKVKIIALSTFTIRRNNQKNRNYSFLYWENLIVDRSHRDGVAYLSIIGYVRKLVRRGEFDDIFFVARRKKALDAHRAARFKTFGYFQILIESIRLKRKSTYQHGLSNLEYSEFPKLFHTKNVQGSKCVTEYVGLENSSNIEIQRWLSRKEGKIIIDDFKKRIYFLRSVFKNKLLELNLLIPSGYTENFPNLSEFGSSLIIINLRIRRYLVDQDRMSRYLPTLRYEALCLKEQKSLGDFEIWEHDAW